MQYFETLNLFPTLQLSHATKNLHAQRIATRLFLATFIVSFSIMLIYTATATITHTLTVSDPSVQQYNELYLHSPQSLSCPCSQISNRYDSFMNIRYVVHPICDSIYVTDEWISNQWISHGTFYSGDFRLWGTQMFFGLRSFCQLIETSINISLTQFYATELVTDIVTHQELLRSQSQAIIEKFITTTTNNFLLFLRSIGNTTQVNALASNLFSNFEFTQQSAYSDVETRWKIYDDNCSCTYHSWCNTTAAMYVGDPWILSWVVPGFYRACYNLEALRQSDFRCLSNSTCLEDLRMHLEPSKQSISLPTLDFSSSRNFKANTSIGVIIDALMVDEWKWNVSHAKFYDKCRPKKCTYVVVGRNSFIGLITILIGITGGLLKVEQFIIPYSVKIVLKVLSRKRKLRVHPCDAIDLQKTDSTVETKLEVLDH